jgi:hypothetical protein
MEPVLVRVRVFMISCYLFYRFVSFSQYLIGLFIVYPFSAILFRLPDKNLKHFFSFFVGFVLSQWIFGPDWIHFFVSSLITYSICCFAPGKYQARLAFVWVMSYMTVCHLYQMYVSYMGGHFDFTGTQMVITMKLTSFAYNLYDGTTDHEKVFITPPTSKEARICQQRKKFAIEKLPNPLEFFGYVFCFTCLLAGPAFEYKDYVDAIDGTAYLKTVSTEKENKKKEIVKPSPMIPAMQSFGISMICLALHLTINMVYNIHLNDQADPVFIATHPSVKIRWMYLMIGLFAEKCKYYFVWKIAEGASILAGFGFDGYEEHHTGGTERNGSWKGVENSDILGTETATSVQSLTRSWNKRTQGWLERYTYQRTGRSLFATYFVSALWHGLYPSYFCFFLSIAAMTAVERLVKEKISPYFCPGYDGYHEKTYPNTTKATVYWYFCWFMTFFGVHYFAQVFSMQSMENAVRAYSSYHFFGHYLFVIVYIGLLLMPTPVVDTKGVATVAGSKVSHKGTEKAGAEIMPVKHNIEKERIASGKMA